MFTVGVALVSASLSLTAMPLASFDQASSAPAPRVLAWASFLGPDGPLTAGVPWSSGSVWMPVAGTWVEVGLAARSTRSQPNARSLGSVPSAGSTGRMVAVVSSLDGSPVVDGGVVAAGTATGSRSAVFALVDDTGALTIRAVPGAPFVTVASTAAGVVTESTIELSVQVIGSQAIATARPLWSRDPTVVLIGSLTPAVASDVAANVGYGIVAHSTTNVEFSALRVEVPA